MYALHFYSLFHWTTGVWRNLSENLWTVFTTILNQYIKVLFRLSFCMPNPFPIHCVEATPFSAHTSKSGKCQMGQHWENSILDLYRANIAKFLSNEDTIFSLSIRFKAQQLNLNNAKVLCDLTKECKKLYQVEIFLHSLSMASIPFGFRGWQNGRAKLTNHKLGYKMWCTSDQANIKQSRKVLSYCVQNEKRISSASKHAERKVFKRRYLGHLGLLETIMIPFWGSLFLLNVATVKRDSSLKLSFQ